MYRNLLEGKAEGKSEVNALSARLRQAEQQLDSTQHSHQLHRLGQHRALTTLQEHSSQKLRILGLGTTCNIYHLFKNSPQKLCALWSCGHCQLMAVIPLADVGRAQETVALSRLDLSVCGKHSGSTTATSVVRKQFSKLYQNRNLEILFE